MSAHYVYAKAIRERAYHLVAVAGGEGLPAQDAPEWGALALCGYDPAPVGWWRVESRPPRGQPRCAECRLIHETGMPR